MTPLPVGWRWSTALVTQTDADVAMQAWKQRTFDCSVSTPPRRCSRLRDDARFADELEEMEHGDCRRRARREGVGRLPRSRCQAACTIRGYRYVHFERMDVGVSELRARLSHWLERARQGDEVVVTDRGVPIARILGLTATTTLDRLAQQGVIARPERQSRPTATGRQRPRSRRPVADIVSDQRG